MISRTNFLNERIESVEATKLQVTKLIEFYKIAEKKQIGEKDLTLRRAKLTVEELDLIMGSMKLVELCVLRKIVAKGKRVDLLKLGSGIYRPQAIAGADVFVSTNTALLTPDQPPALVLTTLPGSSRRPIRPWQLCTDEEKVRVGGNNSSFF